MKKLAKFKNMMFYIFMAICIAFIFSQLKGMDDKLPFGLWYVYSGSMEPTIKTDDGYILISAKEYYVNDIITFKPKVLSDKYVTHRIVEADENGRFITRGDHNQSTDQEIGEPSICKDQIIGKAFMIRNRPIIIPYLGIISKKLNGIIASINIFILISIGISIYVVVYIIDTFYTRNKRSKNKRIRVLDIAPYFDPVFFTLCVILFSNIIFIGITLKSWNPDKISYVVVNTKGISSPLPGERFRHKMNLENLTFLPFVSVLEPEKDSTEVNPKKLILPSKQNKEYTLSIEAPEKIGYYIEKINKHTYPDVLPGKWLDFMYSKSKILPLIAIFSPGILLKILLFVWWLKRWQIGRRKVMEWLIPLMNIVK